MCLQFNPKVRLVHLRKRLCDQRLLLFRKARIFLLVSLQAAVSLLSLLTAKSARSLLTNYSKLSKLAINKGN